LSTGLTAEFGQFLVYPGLVKTHDIDITYEATGTPIWPVFLTISIAAALSTLTSIFSKSTFFD